MKAFSYELDPRVGYFYKNVKTKIKYCYQYTTLKNNYISMLSHTHHTCVYPFNERGHATNVNQLGPKTSHSS